MMNPLLPITEAEETIDGRKQAREAQRPEFRIHLALETIADESIRAEVGVMRGLVAVLAQRARPGAE
jgi:hypothetical protein